MQQIKKYIGRDMSEILERVKSDLGRDAVIIKSGTRKKYFGGGAEFEVVAGIDKDNSIEIRNHQKPAFGDF